MAPWLFGSEWLGPVCGSSTFLAIAGFAKLLTKNKKMPFFKKNRQSRIFHLRLWFVMLRTPFTGAAEALETGRRDG